MRLIILLLTTAIIQVSASSYGQNVTLKQDNAGLKTVLDEIRKQTGYDFFYSDQIMKNAKPVSINLKEVGLLTALEICFKDQPLSYSIENKAVTIKPKEPSFLDRVAERWAAIEVRGRVVDSESGLALAGASVKVKGSNRATTTGSDGGFYLPGVDEKDVIVVSFIGYVTQEMKAKKDLGEIRLVMANADLQEVTINKGYYTESKRLSTSSVGRVTADDIEKQPVSNVLAALQGRVPGLVITQQSGIPGGGFSVAIRGRNSLRNSQSDNGNYPLYIIDGMPYLSKSQTMTRLLGGSSLYSSEGSSPLNSINPSDIESIEILKDADATSIYGSRGANGVILITTKKGKAGDMKFEINSYAGIGKITRKMNLLNTEQYLQMRKEGYKNDGITSYPASAYDINGTWNQDKNTDWQKELLGGTALNADGQISIYGGSSNSQYRFNGGYHKETSVFPGNFSSQRISTTLSVNNSSLNQRFRSTITINYSIGVDNLLSKDLTSIAITTPPNAPELYNLNGSLNFENSTWSNPLVYTKQPFKANTNVLIGNAFLSYKLATGLFLKTNVGYSNTLNDQSLKMPISSLDPNSPSGLKINTTNLQKGYSGSWNIEPQLEYTKTIKQNHKISSLIGSTLQREASEFLNQLATGFPNESQMDNLGAVPPANIRNTFSNSLYKYNAGFIRFNYSYKETFAFNLTGRRDGSSRFGPGRQFGNFGAMGMSWVFSDLPFLKKNLKLLSFGKFRSSYGTTGSDQIPNYGFQDTYTSSVAYQNISGLLPNRLVNPDFSWEKSRKFEVAIEFGLFNDRVKLSSAYYRTRSSNQLVGYPLPSNTGFASVQFNSPATVENKGIEFELSTINFNSNHVKWTTSLNWSLPKNKLVAFPDIESSSYSSSYVIGEPLTIVKLFKSNGIDVQTGEYKIVDVDGNGLFNDVDRIIYSNRAASINGGLSNDISYRGFKLAVFIQFSKQKGSNYLNGFNHPGSVSNQPTEILNRWQNPGDIRNIQKYTSGVSILPYIYNTLSDASVTDASFIRIKNVALSYSLKPSLINKIKLQNVNVYLKAQNLLTFTKYRGLDPETQGSFLPPIRFITAGLQLTL